jgi:hypothetical protein
MVSGRADGGLRGEPCTSTEPKRVCGASSTAPMKITDPYSPTIDPAAFSATIDNPYLPMVPGTRTIYEAHTPDGLQQTTTEVTRDTKMIMGVKTVVVHDTVSLDAKMVEDTLDWYAQDRDGNVWYFGEATKKLEDGTADTGDVLNLTGRQTTPLTGPLSDLLVTKDVDLLDHRPGREQVLRPQHRADPHHGSWRARRSRPS